MRGCMMPMSSPMMKRMLGFCCCWADAGGMAAVKEAAHASAHSHLLCLILIGTQSSVARLLHNRIANGQAVRGRYSAHRCERQFRGDTHLTFLCRVSRPTPCFSYSTHVFNFKYCTKVHVPTRRLRSKIQPSQQLGGLGVHTQIVREGGAPAAGGCAGRGLRFNPPVRLRLAVAP